MSVVHSAVVFDLFGYHWQWKRRWFGHVLTNRVDCKKSLKEEWRTTVYVDWP